EQKADEKLGDTVPPPDSGRPRRAPPTIDLDASEITSETRAVEADPAPEYAAAPEPAAAEHASGTPGPENPQAATPPISPSPISPWVIAPFSGAVAAALVIGVGWMLGWPVVQAPPQINAAAFNQLSSRVAALEAKTDKPSADPALTERTDALGKSIAGLHDELANVRSQSDKLAAGVNALKSAPRDAAGNVDLSPINDHIAQLEHALRAQSAAIAQQNSKIAQAKITQAKSADDLPLRRVVAATLLDVAVRHGDPYASAL